MSVAGSEPEAPQQRSAATGLLGRLGSHPATRFLIAGVLTFVVDAGLLTLLHGVWHLELAFSTVVAFVFAFGVNFSLSRQWTFPAGERTPRGQLARFAVLVSANLISTVLIVTGLASFGVNYLLAKVTAAILNAIGNFFLYRRWIFR
jgi:putative flippase GtrA